MIDLLAELGPIPCVCLGILAYVAGVVLVRPLFAAGQRADDQMEREFWERHEDPDPPVAFRVLDVHRGEAFDYEHEDGAA